MNNLNKKLAINKFSALITKYFMVHAQQENIQKLAEPTSSTMTGKAGNINEMSKKDKCTGSWICINSKAVFVFSLNTCLPVCISTVLSP